jgi:hypothetical protein
MTELKLVQTVQSLRSVQPLRSVQAPSFILPRGPRGRKEVGVERLERFELFERSLIHNQRIVTVSNRRHSRLDAVLFALFQENSANFRILILILDQCAAFA